MHNNTESPIQCYHKPLDMINVDSIEISDVINVHYFNTNLPCSESFLILDYFRKSSKDNITSKLRDYFKISEHKKKYFDGLNIYIKDKKICQEKCNEIWDSILLEIKKETPDYRFIISAIHGHSWVKMIGSAGKYEDIRINDSKDWYKRTNFMEFDPSVRELLDTINNYILEILG